MSAVREHLRLLEGLQTGTSTPAGYTYKSLYEFVLDRGVLSSSGVLTQEELRVLLRARSMKTFPSKACFYNAQRLVLADKTNSLVYNEGFAHSVFFPMHHAWATLNGKVIDLTWDHNGEEILGLVPEGWEYLGVPFPDREQVRLAHKKKFVSLLDDPEDGWPLFKLPRLNSNAS